MQVRALLLLLGYWLLEVVLLIQQAQSEPPQSRSVLAQLVSQRRPPLPQVALPGPGPVAIFGSDMTRPCLPDLIEEVLGMNEVQ